MEITVTQAFSRSNEVRKQTPEPILIGKAAQTTRYPNQASLKLPISGAASIVIGLGRCGAVQ